MNANSKFIWLNGKFVRHEDASFHILNHSLHYGSGVFEGIRSYETRKGFAVFRLHDHVKRLFYSAETMGIKIPYTPKEIENAVLELLEKNELTDAYIRPIAFFSEKMGILADKNQVNLAISAWQWDKYLEKEAVRVKTSSLIRIHPESTKVDAKISGHYVNSILATKEATENGFDEALLLDYKGFVAEGPGENIFFVKGNNIYTPRIGSILPGITRDTVKKIATDLGYKLQEEDIEYERLHGFDEAFFCGTAVEINGIGVIDDIVFSGEREGPVTQKIRELYAKIVRGESENYSSWLTLDKKILSMQNS